MNDCTRLTPQELIGYVISRSGKAGGWPNYFRYDLKGDCITISVDGGILDKKSARRLDPWGLAFLSEANSRCGIEVGSVNFNISGEIDKIKPDRRLVPDLEAFRRRISFLNVNNQNPHFGITVNGEPLELDEVDTLFNRPANEIIRESHERNAQDNTPIHLEKAFQTWLFANDVKDTLRKDSNTNVRLAVLGEDFFRLGKRKLGIIREFPTGVFDANISKKPTNRSRILPTEFVDIVTLNKYDRLAVIELKLNDSQLEVIAQIMDYSLFFRCYRDRLWKFLPGRLGEKPKSKDITCYVVNNHFHNRFDNVMRYYTPRNGLHGFKLVKTILGHYSDIGSGSTPR